MRAVSPVGCGISIIEVLAFNTSSTLTSILGISAFYHDSAAAIVVDGQVVAAAQEERFSRKKHDAAFPSQAVEFCLRQAGLVAADVDHVVFYEKPFKKFERILETHLAEAPFAWQSFCQSMPVWLGTKLFLAREIQSKLDGQYRKRILFPEHHESHAASAFFRSPFEQAAILTVDGVGEWATATLGVGNGNRIKLSQQLEFPDSLGLLYSAFTYFCGFRVNGGEGKLMGLAPSGTPVYADLILEKLIDLKADGSFRMEPSYFNYCRGLTMTSTKFAKLFGGSPRIAEAEITQRERDLAASIQSVTESILLRMANHLHDQTGLKNLCIAGGVALNCVANGRLLRRSPFENVWVPPAVGDAGGAVGAALFTWHQLLDQKRESLGFAKPYLGPSPESSLKECLSDSAKGAAAVECFDSVEQLVDPVAKMLVAGKIVGWVQGPMEFGERALGNRSILASPQNPAMTDRLNEQVKFREAFRPFAPVVLEESGSDLFELDRESPYMTMAANVRSPKLVPAATHVDSSARVQTVAQHQNPELYQLLRAFESKTGCPALINTSFNVRGEPIVCSVEDALDCFLKSGLDALVVGNSLLRKSALSKGEIAAWRRGKTDRDLKLKDSAKSKSWIKRSKRWLHRFSFPLRWLVSRLFLTTIYLLLVTPIGFLRRWFKRTRSSKPVTTYWQSRSTSDDKTDYFKQY